VTGWAGSVYLCRGRISVGGGGGGQKCGLCVGRGGCCLWRKDVCTQGRVLVRRGGPYKRAGEGICREKKVLEGGGVCRCVLISLFLGRT
jgi:hypothetical protein